MCYFFKNTVCYFSIVFKASLYSYFVPSNLVNFTESFYNKIFFCVPLLAVRFGRIPKREKQRLLDEMQSYMNSLNESASMNMASSPSCDPPASPMEIQPKETMGSMTKAYQDIFQSAPDRLTKRANGLSAGSNVPTSFQSSIPQESSFSHLNTPATYHSGVHVGYTAGLCPGQQMPNDNKCPMSSVDNGHYQNHAPSNQIPCQSRVTQSPQANYSSGYAAGEMQAQTTCPWKLAAGSKVLVRTTITL